MDQIQKHQVSTVTVARGFEDIRNNRDISASAYPCTNLFARLFDWIFGTTTIHDGLQLVDSLDAAQVGIFESILQKKTGKSGFLSDQEGVAVLDFEVGGQSLRLLEENCRVNGALVSKLAIEESDNAIIDKNSGGTPKQTVMKFSSFSDVKLACLKAYLSLKKDRADLRAFDLRNMNLSTVDFSGALIDEANLRAIANGGGSLKHAVFMMRDLDRELFGLAKQGGAIVEVASYWD